MEHDLQQDIITYLRLNKVFCFETDVMSGLQYFSHTDNRRYAFIKYHKSVGYVKGQPDLVLLLDGGKCVLVELKTSKGRQSEEQKDFQKAVGLLGFTYLVWRSLDDAIKFVREQANASR